MVPAALGKMGSRSRPSAGARPRHGRPPETQGAATHLSPKLDAVFKAALREAEALKDEYVSTEHLLLALVEGQTASGEVLKATG